MMPVIPHSSLYVFLDEGGNLDFNNSGSRYFILTALSTASPSVVESALTSLKYNLLSKGADVQQFHATTDTSHRESVFRALAEVLPALRVDSIIVEKRKTVPEWQPEEVFYPRILAFLLRYVLHPANVRPYSNIVVITDTLPVNRKREAVVKGIKLVIADLLPEKTYQVYHHASKTNPGLQAADYCNWAILRKWEHNDLQWLPHIKGSLKSEFEVFKSGSRNFY